VKNTIAAIATAIMTNVALSTGAALAADISGAGATFPAPIYAKWAEAYKKETGIGLNYQAIGSGGGIKQIQAKTVTFGATDAPLNGEQLAKDGLIQFPMVMGGIVAVANVDGVTGNALTLDGATLARIYLGEIKSWDDEAIVKLNPGLKLPKQAIAAVYRSDGSGTTANYTEYLSRVSATFKDKVGAGATVQWPTGLGAKGNDGVAATVQQTKGSIGYVEYAYAKANKIAYAKMINKAGKTVEPSLASFQAAAANADWAKTPGYAVILVDQPGDGSWPMTAATFILMYEKPQDPAASAAALKFFDWAYTKGDKLAEELDYVPMPEAVVKLVEATWTKVGK